MNEIIAALILGGSVSSGFSGKPAPELVVERMGLPYRNEARICHKVDAEELDGVKAGTLVINIDGNYWRSYDNDCAAAAKAVREFYVKANGMKKIVATVPDRNAGGFYRFFCGAQNREQVCRPAVNAAIVDGCGDGCTLIDADAIYSKYKHVSDIHLTPEIWRLEAESFHVR